MLRQINLWEWGYGSSAVGRIALPFCGSAFEKSVYGRMMMWQLGTMCSVAGACYDTVNNMLWTCSNDYIDQWCNPGNQAFHYVCQRLGVSHVITEPKGEVRSWSDRKSFPSWNKLGENTAVSVSGSIGQATKCVTSLPALKLETQHPCCLMGLWLNK